MKYYEYYHTAYDAVLGDLLGSFAVRKPGGEWKAEYGLKAFCPVASGWGFSHCQDFGNARSFGFARKHLGNDLMAPWRADCRSGGRYGGGPGLEPLWRLAGRNPFL